MRLNFCAIAALVLLFSCSPKEQARKYDNFTTDWQEDNLSDNVKSVEWFYARLVDKDGKVENTKPIAHILYNELGMRSSAVNYDHEGTVSLLYEYDKENRLIKRISQSSDPRLCKENHITYGTHGKAIESRLFRTDSLHSCVYSDYDGNHNLLRLYNIQDNDTSWRIDCTYDKDNQLTHTIIQNVTNLEQHLKYDIFKNFMERFDIHLSPSSGSILTTYEYDDKNRRRKERYYRDDVLFRETSFDESYNLVAETVKDVLDMKYEYKIDKRDNWTEQRAYQLNTEDNSYDLLFVKTRRIEYFD